MACTVRLGTMYASPLCNGYIVDSSVLLTVRDPCSTYYICWNGYCSSLILVCVSIENAKQNKSLFSHSLVETVQPEIIVFLSIIGEIFFVTDDIKPPLLGCHYHSIFILKRIEKCE